MANKTYWTEGWTAYEAILGKMLTPPAGESAADAAMLAPIRASLSKLRGFGQCQADYFAANRAQAEAWPDDIKRSVPNYDSAMDILLRQVGHDMMLYQLTASQRGDLGGDVRNTLVAADKTAAVLLPDGASAGKSLCPPDASIATYFDKRSMSRTIPYDDGALVGLRWTTLSFPKSAERALDLLAIPHEIGHYLYWRQLPTGAPFIDLAAEVRKRTRVVPQPGEPSLDVLAGQTWVLRWVEEIFADVVGCVLAGPAAAWSMQRISMRRLEPAVFYADDGEHPTSAVRPYVALTALAASNVAADRAWVAPLKTRWLKELSRLGGKPLTEAAADQITLGLSDGGTQTLGQSRRVVDEVVAIALRFLRQYGYKRAAGLELAPKGNIDTQLSKAWLSFATTQWPAKKSRASAEKPKDWTAAAFAEWQQAQVALFIAAYKQHQDNAFADQNLLNLVGAVVKSPAAQRKMLEQALTWMLTSFASGWAAAPGEIPKVP